MVTKQDPPLRCPTQASVDQKYVVLTLRILVLTYLRTMQVHECVRAICLR